MCIVQCSMEDASEFQLPQPTTADWHANTELHGRGDLFVSCESCAVVIYVIIFMTTAQRHRTLVIYDCLRWNRLIASSPFLLQMLFRDELGLAVLLSLENNNSNHRFTAIIQVSVHYLAPPVKNSRILLLQSFTAHMPLLVATSAYGLGRNAGVLDSLCTFSFVKRTFGEN